jgi:uncharacterized SAM-binding protein YcdF (DUF218 family)
MTQVQDTQPLNGPTVGPMTTWSAIQEPEPASSEPATRRCRAFWAETGRWLVTLVVFVILAGVFLSASLLAAIYWQARTDQIAPVDAIVVLGAAQYDGRPSPVLRARLDEALVAFRDGVAPLVVVSGGRQPGDRYTEAEASRDYLIEHGVPRTAILLENEGRTSEQSMDGVAKILRPRGLHRILLVSDGFHLFRLKIMARHLGLTALGLAASTSPIKQGSKEELSYVIREAGGIVAYLWEIR